MCVGLPDVFIAYLWTTATQITGDIILVHVCLFGKRTGGSAVRIPTVGWEQGWDTGWESKIGYRHSGDL